jgi:hypothetical protein
MKKIIFALAVAFATLCCQQLAAQTQINQTGISSFPYTITKPGSYILTSNINAGTALYAFLVEANNVTLNLNGFTVSGAVVCSPSSCNTNNNTFGIYSFSSYTNTTVENGTVTGFNNGVNINEGTIHDLTVTSAYDCIAGYYVNIHNNFTFSCVNFGIYDEFGTIKDNTVSSGANFGIYGNSATIVNNNVAHITNYGIYAETGMVQGNSTMYSGTDLTLLYSAVSNANACSAGAC